jgi:hypothetical protein
MDILKNRPDVIDAFDTAVTACLVSSTCLEKFVWKITSGVLNGEKSTWANKFKMLWNEPKVIELSGHLQTQQIAISLVVGLLQM